MYYLMNISVCFRAAYMRPLASVNSRIHTYIYIYIYIYVCIRLFTDTKGFMYVALKHAEMFIR